MDHLCYFCLVLLCFHARLFVVALWSTTGKGLISWLSFVISYCDVVTFLLVGILGQVWCLIVSIPDLYPLSYLIIRVFLSVLRGGPKSLPTHSFNALIIPILKIECTII